MNPDLQNDTSCLICWIYLDSHIDNLNPKNFFSCLQMQSLNELLDQLKISIQISTTETGSLALVSFNPNLDFGEKYSLTVLCVWGGQVEPCLCYDLLIGQKYFL